MATETAPAPALPDLQEVSSLLAGLTDLTQALQSGDMTEEDQQQRLRELASRAVDLARPVIASSGLPLLRYSTYLHVGAGATECEDGEDGTCGDPMHFHAWLRLPNQFQHNEIREKGLAAKARRQRLLRDEDSDARLVLDEELAAIRRADDKEALVYELVNIDSWKDQLQALQEVEEQEGFEHVNADRERLRELELAWGEEVANADPDAETPEPGEDLKKLREHFENYALAVETALLEVQAPKFAALRDKSIDDLIELVREQRIEQDGQAEFMHQYSVWTWFYGTYTTKKAPDGKHRTRRFSNMEALREAEPEVVESLQITFQELESVMSRGAAGNP